MSAVTTKTKQKKGPPAEIVPDNPKNRTLSKKDFQAQEIIRRERAKKVEAYRKKLMEEEGLDPNTPSSPKAKDEIGVMEEQLGILAQRASDAEMDADSAESEKKSIALKKQVKALKTKITIAKKAKAKE